ncbi:MAG TPA: DUF6677 family protein [Pyrinomonadaceae bacterium]|nr:DUF6677 family protein [Pyrinomonadaceae bacterium]
MAEKPKKLNPFTACGLAWLFPGAGHFAIGKAKRGIVISASIWLMLIIGLISKGAYYPGFDYKDGQLLYLMNFFAKLGSFTGGLVTFLGSVTPDPKAAASPVFEYGGRLIEIAGLLNYLATLDVFDILSGRKQ